MNKKSIFCDTVKVIDISIVVCTYNRKEMLANALTSLVLQKTEGKYRFEIIVVDDGSTDGTKDTVTAFKSKNLSSTIIYVINKGCGIADARNSGVEESRGQWIVFFDDDQWAEPQWLDELFKVATSTKADCVGGSIVLDYSASIEIQLSDFCRGLLGERISPRGVTKYPFNQIPSTGNIMIDRTMFGKVGKFNPQMHHGGEDSEFFWRARSLGVTEWWRTSNAVIYHIIPELRLSEEFFRHISINCGVSSAMIRHRFRGKARWILSLAREILDSLGRNIWLLLFACALQNVSWKLNFKCKIWKTLGYLKMSLRYLFPRIFSRKKLESSLNFRKRGIVHKEQVKNGVLRYGKTRY